MCRAGAGAGYGGGGWEERGAGQGAGQYTEYGDQYQDRYTNPVLPPDTVTDYYSGGAGRHRTGGGARSYHAPGHAPGHAPQSDFHSLRQQYDEEY